MERLSVSPEEATNIAYKSRKQADDISGLWQSQRVGRVTASHFGEVCKRKRPWEVLGSYAYKDVALLYYEYVT